MAVVTILKNRKIAVFPQWMDFFYKIWHGDEPRPAKPPQQTKFNIVANRHLEKSKKIMISQKIEQNFSVPCVLMHNGHP